MKRKKSTLALLIICVSFISKFSKHLNLKFEKILIAICTMHITAINDILCLCPLSNEKLGGSRCKALVCDRGDRDLFSF